MQVTLEHPLTTTQPQVSNPTDDIEMQCAADHPVQTVQWLWPGRIPIGKVTMLTGDPGLGKTLVALDIAARVTRRAPWPDADLQTPTPTFDGLAFDSTADHPAAFFNAPHSAPPSEPGSVLILSAIDDFGDTIRPRLDAAGADPSRIFMLPSVADLRHDLNKLRQAIDRVPDCRLILIDPVNAYVGPSDSHFHTVVRRVFKPLAKLAVEKGIAILAVNHFRKNEGAVIQRAAGSMGFVAAARAVWTVCHDPDCPGRNLFLPLKNNLVATLSGLAYTIESRAPDTAPAVVWQRFAVVTSAADALESANKHRGPEADELNAATDWLRSELVLCHTVIFG